MLEIVPMLSGMMSQREEIHILTLMKEIGMLKGIPSTTQLLYQKGLFVIGAILPHRSKATQILDPRYPAGNLIRIPQVNIIHIGCQTTAGIISPAVNLCQIAIPLHLILVRIAVFHRATDLSIHTERALQVHLDRLVRLVRLVLLGCQISAIHRNIHCCQIHSPLLRGIHFLVPPHSPRLFLVTTISNLAI